MKWGIVFASTTFPEPDRAVALWRELIEAGGEDAGFARYGLVELCFEQARDAEAWEHLRALEDEPADAGPAGLVAELLVERGEYEAALRWFNRAIGALSTDEVAAIGEPGGAPRCGATRLGHEPTAFATECCLRAVVAGVSDGRDPCLCARDCRL